MENPLVWVGLGTLLVAVGTLLFTVANHIYGRIATVDGQRSKDVAELHAKIEAIKDGYVRRDDFREDLQRLERGQVELARTVADMAKEVHDLGKMLAARFGIEPKGGD